MHKGTIGWCAVRVAFARRERVEAALDAGDVLLERGHRADHLVEIPLQLGHLFAQAHDLVERLPDGCRDVALCVCEVTV
jgi:hypothetical protein